LAAVAVAVAVPVVVQLPSLRGLFRWPSHGKWFHQMNPRWLMAVPEAALREKVRGTAFERFQSSEQKSLRSQLKSALSTPLRRRAFAQTRMTTMPVTTRTKTKKKTTTTMMTMMMMMMMGTIDPHC